VAGHSHWAGIKHKKGVNDAKRGKIFSKHARLITTATRIGGADPDMNLRLKYAIDKAKADNRPKDNIERAVKKGSGAADGANFESVLYEGYLAGGVAVLIDALTDNRNRTAPELRRILEKRGGNLAVGGAVSWMFEQKAVFQVSSTEADEDSLIEIAAEVGAEDVREAGEFLEVIAGHQAFASVREALVERKVSCARADITFLPKNTVAVTDVEVGRQVLSALDDLENNEDVQETYCNFDISDELLSTLG
jgi:YebC/PmpR family DNA-binding regulatory protein